MELSNILFILPLRWLSLNLKISLPYLTMAFTRGTSATIQEAIIAFRSRSFFLIVPFSFHYVLFRSILRQRTVIPFCFILVFFVEERLHPPVPFSVNKIGGGGRLGGYFRGVQDKSFVEKRLLKNFEMTFL